LLVLGLGGWIHVAVNGISSSHQRLAWNERKKKEKPKKVQRVEAVEAVEALVDLIAQAKLKGGTRACEGTRIVEKLVICLISPRWIGTTRLG